jgi:predicted ATPase
MFDFDDLCNRPLAAADYIALADRFHTLAVADVPVFNAANRAAAYRFVTLIDVMYEHRWVAAFDRYIHRLGVH